MPINSWFVNTPCGPTFVTADSKANALLKILLFCPNILSHADEPLFYGSEYLTYA